MQSSCSNYRGETEKKKKKKKKVEMPGIEPGASHMRSERSTTELHPQSGEVLVITLFKGRLTYSSVPCNNQHHKLRAVSSQTEHSGS